MFVEENVEWDTGTRIRVRLRPEIQRNSEQFLLDVRRYLREVVVRPSVDTAIELGSAPFSVGRQSWLKLKKTAKDVAAALNMEIIQISLADLSQIISGVAFLMLRKTDGKLSMFGPGQGKIRWFNERTPQAFFEGYAGNRVTVNGFKMTLKGQKRLHSRRKTTLPMAFDIEVQPDNSVVFDVPRDKLLGETKPVIVNEFRSAVYRSLLQSGVLDRLDNPSREWFDVILLTKFAHVEPTSKAQIPDEALLNHVRSALPADSWPAGIHKSIARDLHLSPNLVSRAISTLIDRGLVSNPNPPWGTSKVKTS